MERRLYWEISTRLSTLPSWRKLVEWTMQTRFTMVHLHRTTCPGIFSQSSCQEYACYESQASWLKGKRSFTSEYRNLLTQESSMKWVWLADWEPNMVMAEQSLECLKRINPWEFALQLFTLRSTRILESSIMVKVTARSLFSTVAADEDRWRTTSVYLLGR